MLHELHSQGRTIEEIEKCLKRVPMNPRIAAAIKAAHDFGYVSLWLWLHFSLLFIGN